MAIVWDMLAGLGRALFHAGQIVRCCLTIFGRTFPHISDVPLPVEAPTRRGSSIADRQGRFQVRFGLWRPWGFPSAGPVCFERPRAHERVGLCLDGERSRIVDIFQLVPFCTLQCETNWASTYACGMRIMDIWRAS